MVSPKEGESFESAEARWWAANERRLAPTTRKGYEQLLRCHVRPFFQGKRIDQISRNDVDEFISERLDSGLGGKYVGAAVSVLSQVIEFADLPTKNPAAGHQIWDYPKPLETNDVLTMEQLELLSRHIRDPYKPLLWLMVMTGLRPAEVCGLQVRSLRSDAHIIEVRETLNVVNGKMYRWPTPERDISLPPSLCDELKTMLQKRQARRVKTLLPTGPLFESVHGYKPLKPADLRRRIIRPALEAAGLPVHFRSFDLRHTHAALMLDAGDSVQELAKRLGHGDISLAATRYGHFMPRPEEVAARFEAMRSERVTGVEPA